MLFIITRREFVTELYSRMKVTLCCWRFKLAVEPPLSVIDDGEIMMLSDGTCDMTFIRGRDGDDDDI